MKKRRGPIIKTDWVVETLSDHMVWIVIRIYDFKPDPIKDGKYWPQPFRITERKWRVLG